MKDYQREALVRAYQLFESFATDNAEMAELFETTKAKASMEGRAWAFRLAAEHIKSLCNIFDIELLPLQTTKAMEAEAEILHPEYLTFHALQLTGGVQ